MNTKERINKYIEETVSRHQEENNLLDIIRMSDEEAKKKNVSKKDAIKKLKKKGYTDKDIKYYKTKSPVL